MNNFFNKLSWHINYHLEPFRDKYFSTINLRKFKGESFDGEISWEWGSRRYNRIALVNQLLSRFERPNYLEIGCATNVLFDATYAPNKIGVDPEIGGTHRMSSDKFFETNSQFFDVIFIDGLHTYEQVQRDLINSLEVLSPGGFIAFHDMLPGSWIAANNPRIMGGTWNGDVWKVAFELSESPDIDFIVVKIDQGVGVLRKKSSEAKLTKLNGELLKLKYNYFYEHYERLPLRDWDDFQKWFTGK